MNNEPVAWIDEETGCFVYSQYEYEDLDEYGKDGLIPLYTHPAKTLDRELLDKTIIDQQNEIKELRKNLDVALMIVNKPAKTLTDEEINQIATDCGWGTGESYDDCICCSRFIELDFARAILKKANEK